MSALEGLFEQYFALTYGIPGCNWQTVDEMDTKERTWMLKRLRKQKERENPKKRGG